MPEISIVLPVYNGERYLSKAIESIINQTFTDWELIVVNDCSTDSSEKIVREYLKKDSRIRLINNEVNKKLPESLNVGFREAVGRYLTWTSDDNRYKENALGCMYEYLEANMECMMVRADMTVVNESGEVLWNQDNYNDEIMFVSNSVGACFLYKRNVWEEVGEYDRDMFLVEDYEYWIRIIVKYGHISHLKENLYYYLEHNNSLTAKKKTNISKQLARMQRKYIGVFLKKLYEYDYHQEIIEMYYHLLMYNLLDDSAKMQFYSYFSFLENFVDIKESKKIILYGAGGNCDHYFKENGNRVIAIIDNDKQKQGNLINNKTIISIKEYKNKYDGIPVLITVGKKYWLEVIKILYDNDIKYSI